MTHDRPPPRDAGTRWSKARHAVSIAGSLLLAQVSSAAEPKIDPAAAAWVIVVDIPPYAIDQASVDTGNTSLAQSFGETQDDVDAAAHYRDEAHGLIVEVRVVRYENPAFLEHRIGSAYRDEETGRLESSESA